MYVSIVKMHHAACCSHVQFWCLSPFSIDFQVPCTNLADLVQGVCKVLLLLQQLLQTVHLRLYGSDLQLGGLALRLRELLPQLAREVGQHGGLGPQPY